MLDEPTVALHISDVERLTHVLPRLVDRGLWVVVIFGLGVNGGRVVAEAVPERLAGLAESHTGAALRPVLSGAVLAEALAAA